MREREIEKALVDGVKSLGGRAYKWTSPGNDGVPDRIVILPWRPPVFVELKTETGKLTALQKAQIRKLQALGQDVRVLKGIREVEGFLAGCREEAKDGIQAARLPEALYRQDHRD